MTLEVNLRQTCAACPEQYDAYVGAHRVGYLRLRWGTFSVTCPWVGGEEVYSADLDHEYQGGFSSAEQRAEHLEKAKAAILEWRNAHKDEIL